MYTSWENGWHNNSTRCFVLATINLMESPPPHLPSPPGEAIAMYGKLKSTCTEGCVPPTCR